MNKARDHRERDLRVLNCVSDSEYESRMAVWHNLISPKAPIEEAKKFVDSAFNRLEADLKASGREVAISYSDFVTMANEELQYIRVYVADTKSQYFWYGTIAITVCLLLSLYL
ncbi:thiamine-phosphate diphosphorylase [Vibrio sp. TRT 21S02]|uniref:thiamine-phosphate diphosphorylase n=1 Tax=unclassified Vibrio TaxID=2614977 RepID=UPI00349F3403